MDDVLEGTGTISDVYEKEKSSGGKLEFYVTETNWKDATTGEPVCKAIFTLAINVRPPKDLAKGLLRPPSRRAAGDVGQRTRAGTHVPARSVFDACRLTRCARSDQAGQMKLIRRP